jgi:hypothetical protein
MDTMWKKWVRNTGRNVGEVVWTFGPGVAGLIGGMSLIGHKVSGTVRSRKPVTEVQEWRFIIYGIPILVLVAAIASASLYVKHWIRYKG